MLAHFDVSLFVFHIIISYGTSWVDSLEHHYFILSVTIISFILINALFDQVVKL